MGTTRRATEDVRHVEGMAKKTSTTWMKIVPVKPNLNCQETHPTFSRTCNIYKREKEIMEVKYRRSIIFLEARKIVESYMKVNTNAKVVQKASSISNKN